MNALAPIQCYDWVAPWEVCAHLPFVELISPKAKIMELSDYFRRYLGEIQPTAGNRKLAIQRHETLPRSTRQ